jgi:hypothetical protein
LKHSALYSICSVALFIFGCPKRQTSPRLIYVPAPPPAASVPSEPASGTLVIPAPQPAETVEAVPAPEAAKPKPVRRRRRASPTEAETPEPSPQAAPSEAAVPALEARESPQQQGELRRQIIQLHADIEGRMAQLHPASLNTQEKKTLDDAQLFLSQSQRALVNGDLTRALNLARKASLLVDSLEQGR